MTRKKSVDIHPQITKENRQQELMNLCVKNALSIFKVPENNKLIKINNEDKL